MLLSGFVLTLGYWKVSTASREGYKAHGPFFMVHSVIQQIFAEHLLSAEWYTDIGDFRWSNHGPAKFIVCWKDTDTSRANYSGVWQMQRVHSGGRVGLLKGCWLKEWVEAEIQTMLLSSRHMLPWRRGAFLQSTERHMGTSSDLDWKDTWPRFRMEGKLSWQVTSERRLERWLGISQPRGREERWERASQAAA